MAAMGFEEKSQIQKQLQREWDKILHAQGFGRCWYKWVLGYEQFPYVPLEWPDIPMLQEFAQLTEHACEASCNLEAACRRKAFQYRIQIDDSDNFGSFTYKIIKNKNDQKLQEVPDKAEFSNWAKGCTGRD